MPKLSKEAKAIYKEMKPLIKVLIDTKPKLDELQNQADSLSEEDSKALLDKLKAWTKEQGLDMNEI